MHRKLSELEDYLEALLSRPWARTDRTSGLQQGLDREAISFGPAKPGIITTCSRNR